MNFDDYLKSAFDIYNEVRSPWLKLADIQELENEIIDANNARAITTREYTVLYSLVDFLNVRIKMQCDKHM